MRLGDGQESTVVLTLPRPTLKYDIPYNTTSKHVIFRRKMGGYETRRANSKETVACANIERSFKLHSRAFYATGRYIKMENTTSWNDSLTNQTCLSTIIKNAESYFMKDLSKWTLKLGLDRSGMKMDLIGPEPQFPCYNCPWPWEGSRSAYVVE